VTTSLHLSAGTYDDLIAHLLPSGGKYEEAAFLFAMPHRTGHDLELRVIECAKLGADDFAARYSDYLELKDDVRGRLIKRAHDLRASLVEMHSHVGPFRAAFSYSDINGLKDNVPHFWWRLKSRPYAAIVVARDGIDALVWVDDPETPVALDEIYDGKKVILPQGTTWREWP
jgi:hypothetical protein